MALNLSEGWSIPVIVRGIQVKATMRQCLTSQTGKCDKMSCWESVGTGADSAAHRSTRDVTVRKSIRQRLLKLQICLPLVKRSHPWGVSVGYLTDMPANGKLQHAQHCLQQRKIQSNSRALLQRTGKVNCGWCLNKNEENRDYICIC